MSTFFVVLDKLERLEEKYGMIVSIVGVALILIVIALVCVGCYALIAAGGDTIDWSLRIFFDIKLY